MLLVLLAAACRNDYWRPAPVVPHQMIAATHPKRIRVKLSDSSVLVLKDPEVSSDSIAGASSGKRISVPSARIVRTDVPPGLETAEPMISTWHTDRHAPHEVISRKRPERVRVTLTDSTRLELAHPVSVGDSIIGFVAKTRTAVASAGRRQQADLLVISYRRRIRPGASGQFPDFEIRHRICPPRAP